MSDVSHPSYESLHGTYTLLVDHAQLGDLIAIQVLVGSLIRRYNPSALTSPDEGPSVLNLIYSKHHHRVLFDRPGAVASVVSAKGMCNYPATNLWQAVANLAVEGAKLTRYPLFRNLRLDTGTLVEVSKVIEGLQKVTQEIDTLILCAPQAERNGLEAYRALLQRLRDWAGSMWHGSPFPKEPKIRFDHMPTSLRSIKTLTDLVEGRRSHDLLTKQKDFQSVWTLLHACRETPNEQRILRFLFRVWLLEDDWHDDNNQREK